jgi:hypothetical protein
VLLVKAQIFAQNATLRLYILTKIFVSNVPNSFLRAVNVLINRIVQNVNQTNIMYKKEAVIFVLKIYKDA